jgi:hypothetical protein
MATFLYKDFLIMATGLFDKDRGVNKLTIAAPLGSQGLSQPH